MQFLSTEFLNVVQDNFLTQDVLEPGARMCWTEFSAHRRNLLIISMLSEPLGCSDHNQIYFIIKVKGA